jgi:hypothetical protein
MKAQNETDLGANRTGIATSPIDSRRLIEASEKLIPSDGDAMALAPVRQLYARESEPLGTMPPPASAKEALKTVFKAIQGEKATVLIDKLGERLAFERTGTRLYEGLLGKYDAFGSWPRGPSREHLELFHAQELAHFELLRDTLEKMGSDPTVITPSADLHAVITQGAVQAMGDPRVDLKQGLEAILVAELADNACWENLVRLARSLQLEELAEGFRVCLEEEELHLATVQGWLMASLEKEAGVELQPLPA